MAKLEAGDFPFCFSSLKRVGRNKVGTAEALVARRGETRGWSGSEAAQLTGALCGCEMEETIFSRPWRRENDRFWVLR